MVPRPEQFPNKLAMLLSYKPLNHLPKLLVSFLKIQGLHALLVAPRGHAHPRKSRHYFLGFHRHPYVCGLKSDDLILKVSGRI